MGLVAGYVLAGGESSRMQRPDLPLDKALLSLAGQTLLECALMTVSEVSPSPRILCGTAERCARLQHLGHTVADRVPQAGPLGGLHAAVCDAETQGAAWVLLVPVDLPWLPAHVLREFVQRAMQAGSAAACMRSEGFVQPLPTLVSTGTQAALYDLLQAGERKLQPALRRIAAQSENGELCLIETEQLHAGTDEGSRWFWNVNTPDDFQVAQRDETLGGAAHQSKHGG